MSPLLPVPALLQRTAGEPAEGVLREIAAEPALVQLLALAVLAAGAALVVARLRRRIREASRRARLHDYLVGLEQYAHGDPVHAAERLRRVVAQDPENVAARLVLAEALGDLGETGEAHRHHVELERAFGVRSWRNAAGLARSLLAAGRATEAIEPAQRAAALAPDEPSVQSLLFEVLEAAGSPEATAAAGERLLRSRTGPDRAELAERVARAWTSVASRALDAGDLRAAERGAERAAATGARFAHRRLVARLLLHMRDERAARTLLLGQDQPVAALLPVPSGSASSSTTDARSLPALDACAEPALFGPLLSPSRIADAIEANRAHVQRLCTRWARGDEAAFDALVELGDDAVEEVLLRALQLGPRDTRFPRVLNALGPSVLPQLFQALRERRDGWRARFGDWFQKGSVTAVLGQVVRGFGREAARWFEEADDSGDLDLRKARIDFFVGLGDPQIFERVLGEFPPIEIVHRLNDTPDDVLQRFIAALPPESFLIEGLLPHPAFARDVSLFDAIPGSAAPEQLEAVLLRRGFARSTTAALVDRLIDPERHAIAARVLDGFGERALDALLAVFADLDRPPELRERVAERLVAAGEPAARRACEFFGSERTPLDAELVALLGRIGDAGLPAIRRAYEQGGVLGRLGIRRRRHRRGMLLSALTAVGTPAARTVLRDLGADETDPDLRLRIAHVLHRDRHGNFEGGLDERTG